MTAKPIATRCVTAVLVAGALLAGSSPLYAASYQYRQYLPGFTQAPVVPAATPEPEPPAAIVLSLGTSALPPGQVSIPYSYDFNQLLQVTGDPSYSASQVAWGITQGSLPPGLLMDKGVLSGTPTTKNTSGSSFQVTASYKTETGQQVFTLVVNGYVFQVTQISAGATHTCAITTAGGAKCWGLNDYGQLGDGSTTTRLKPVDVAGLTSGVTSISTTYRHTCVVVGGTAKCWGQNSFGQLGNNSLVNSVVPVDVSNLSSGVASITTGMSHTCAITSAGGAKCWGRNAQGQIGDNTATSRSVPVDVSGLTTGVQAISAATFHTCALTSAGGAKCWGIGSSGQVGNGGTSGSVVPVDVSGLTGGVAAISAGGNMTCALTTGSGLKCWGENTYGQIGDNSLTNRLTPVDVSGMTTGVASVSVGGAHTCATTTAGGAWCWGNGGYSQLGDAAVTNRRTPVSVTGATSGVARIVASQGNGHTCYFTTDGTLYCWGYNTTGQVGDGATAQRYNPISITP